MKREYLRKIIKEEIDNFKKANLKEDMSLSDMSDAKYEFDQESSMNMDCDVTLPHSCYTGVHSNGDTMHAFIWVEGPSGKAYVLVMDGEGKDAFEKKYNSLMEALIVFKRIIKKKAIRMMVRNKSYLT